MQGVQSTGAVRTIGQRGSQPVTMACMAVPEDVITRWQGVSAFAVWAGAIVAAIVIGLTARDEYLTWLPIAFAGAVIVTFLLQLGIQRKEGFVQRVTWSIVGSAVVLAAATGLFALLG
jgi:hypothetical protein